MSEHLPFSFFDKTTAVTTISGLVGGVYKSASLPHPSLLYITFDGSLTVVTYAVFSAAAGYITKFVFDFLRSKSDDE